MSNTGSNTRGGKHGKGDGERFTGDGVPRTVSSIPLTDVDARTPAEASIGNLVKDATTQVSTLVRAEVELAKANEMLESPAAGTLLKIVAEPGETVLVREVIAIIESPS